MKGGVDGLPLAAFDAGCAKLLILSTRWKQCCGQDHKLWSHHFLAV